jgi:hypothetical protein
MKMLTSFKNKLLLSTLMLFSSILAFAQDKKVDVDINVDKGNQSQWYTQPWVWIVGGAVFILLIVALTRGGRKD